MDFTSGNFLLFVLGLTFLYHLNQSRQFKRWLMLIANIVFVASFVSEPLQIAPFVAFLLLGYAATRGMRLQPPRYVFGLSILVLLIIFAVLKHYAFLGGLFALPFPYLEVGLSYMLFRILQMMIDGYAGDVERPLSPLSFFNFTCNFLCFVSGPIQRSIEFAAAENSLGQQLNSEQAFAAFLRIVTGYVKFAVVSAIAYYFFDHLTQTVLAPSALAVPKFSLMYASAAVAYTFYLYYNFSGYMDIVIGIGWLLGQNLPENFDKPFSARNLFEFWSRWHMTLSNWFKTYLFNPLLMALGGVFSAPAVMPYLGVVAFFVTFFVMGVWHGSTFVFVIYGLVMGAGVCVNKLWQIFMTTWLGKKRYKALSEQKTYQYLSRGLTFAFFSIAVTGLWVDMAQLSLLAHQLGIAGLGISFVAIACGFSIAAYVLDLSTEIFRGGSLLTAVADGVLTRQFILAGRVLMIMAITSFFHKAPEFVYKAF